MTWLRRAGVGAAAVAALAAAPGPAAAQAPTATPPTRGALSSDGPTDRYLLGGPWLYAADPNDIGLSAGWWRNTASTAGWVPTTIPNAYNAGDFSSASMYGYVGWYRRDFTLPARAFSRATPSSGRGWLIQFESVNYRATVWLNGHRVGAHTGAYLPFELDLTRYVRRGVNRLVVRVDDRRTAADLPPGPGGGWWNFGGILDAVYLRPVQRAVIESLALRPALPCPACTATIDEQATVRNPTHRTQTVHLTGTYGPVRLDFGRAAVPPGASWSPQRSFEIAHPRLWSPGHPSLYRVTLALSDASGRRLDGYLEQSGIDTARVTRSGRLELNGRVLDLRGVNLHEQDPLGSGAALTVAQMRQRIAWIKQLHATVVRAHYPLAPEMEEMADRAGILLWSEVPVYQVGNPYLGDPAWRARALALLKDNIRANRDHPSILLWSIGNELPTPVTPNEAGYIRAAVRAVHQLDPGRPVGMAVSDWPGVPCQPAYAPLEVIGVNEYFGWFDAGGGSTDDRDELGPFLDSVRACYPHQALMVTEFGFNGNRQGPVEDRGTYAFQDDSIRYHLGVFATKRWLSGAIYFNLQDFASRPGYDGSNPIGTPPFVTNGLVDLYGKPKSAFGVAASMYKATRQIAPPR